MLVSQTTEGRVYFPERKSPLVLRVYNKNFKTVRTSTKFVCNIETSYTLKTFHGVRHQKVALIWEDEYVIELVGLVKEKFYI